MTDQEYTERVIRFIDEVLPQCGHLVLDFGNLNELAMEARRRHREWEEEENGSH